MEAIMARYIADNIGESDRNQGEFGFLVGVTLPTGTNLSGQTASCIIEAPGGDVIEETATISGVSVYHTVGDGELDEAGWWWYWIVLSGGSKYGPIGINVAAVPEVNA
jgi:hypothetical protein